MVRMTTREMEVLRRKPIAEEVTTEFGGLRESLYAEDPTHANIPGNGHGSPLTERNGGYGTTPWEMVVPTQTYQPAYAEATGVHAELMATKHRQRQLEDKMALLEPVVLGWLSTQLDSEAVATYDEDAMNLLAGMAEAESVATDSLTELLERPEQWLSIARLVQAGFVTILGSYLRLTDRGREVLEMTLCDEEGL